jgi:hypothetical protein
MSADMLTLMLKSYLISNAGSDVTMLGLSPLQSPAEIRCVVCGYASGSASASTLSVDDIAIALRKADASLSLRIFTSNKKLP